MRKFNLRSYASEKVLRTRFDMQDDKCRLVFGRELLYTPVCHLLSNVGHWVQPLLSHISKADARKNECRQLTSFLPVCIRLAAHRIGVVMKNPWTKKNPLMSMWLSGANRVAGSARGQASAAAKRQAVDFWTTALTPPKPKKRKSRR